MPIEGDKSIMGERRRNRPRSNREEEIALRQREMKRRQSEAPYPQEQRKAIPQDHTYIDPKRIQQGRRMAKRKAERKRRRMKSVLLVIGLILLFAGAYAAAKIWVRLDSWQGKAEKSDFSVSAAAQKEIKKEPTILTAAILGTDEDGFRADVNIVACYHTDTGELNLISVPRDSRVTMTAEMIAHQEELGRTVPQRNGVYGQCKLTELHAYAGEGNRCAYSVAMLEEILGIDIPYYVKVDLDAFKEIVDAVGGVDFYVPMDMYWDMRDTGGPLINLKEGMQHLDGEKAEQLVRFRDGYAQKDLKRIQVQQDFIKALIEKICSSETLMKNLNNLMDVVLDCSESNITIAEALQYMKYIKDFDPEKITKDTLPYIGDPGSYVDLDEEGIQALVDERIRGIAPEEGISAADTDGMEN